MVAVILKRPETAAMLMGAFEGLCQRYGVRPPRPSALPQRPRVLPALREALDSRAVEAAIERGRRMTLDEAVALVVELGVTMNESAH